MAGKRKNGEGCWGKKIIKGVQYRYYRDINGRYYYGKTEKEIKEKIKRAPSFSSSFILCVFLTPRPILSIDSSDSRVAYNIRMAVSSIVSAYVCNFTGFTI